MTLFIQAVILGITLAMDAISISISKALAAKKVRISNAIKLATVFGVFQAVMPYIGFLVGCSFYNLIKDYFCFLSCAILMFIGIKMIYEHFKNDARDENGVITIRELIILGIATSIDALAAGFVFSGNEFITVLLNCLIIGITTFVICAFGYICAGKVAKILGNKGDIIGGVILILLGLKFLLEYFIKKPL